MSREILFRGKQKTNGEWAYGHFYETRWSGKNVTRIYNGNILTHYTVLPETVGQYTGLTDKNGKKIFEGDIVRGTFYGFPMPLENYVFVIGWQEDVAGYKANYFENVEVIGNIHDNPELLN